MKTQLLLLPDTATTLPEIPTTYSNITSLRGVTHYSNATAPSVIRIRRSIEAGAIDVLAIYVPTAKETNISVILQVMKNFGFEYKEGDGLLSLRADSADISLTQAINSESNIHRLLSLYPLEALK